ncbi:hypothetical protein AAG570_003926 [Ranatra chinensis]|uniref:Uncharacterized protein n=1 Tax=Ranatra chinensis TaxID=642074 RepID=A0ABD0Y2D2_9HEMI
MVSKRRNVFYRNKKQEATEIGRRGNSFNVERVGAGMGERVGQTEGCAPSPLTGAYLLVILPQPHLPEHKDAVLHSITKGRRITKGWQIARTDFRRLLLLLQTIAKIWFNKQCPSLNMLPKKQETA